MHATMVTLLIVVQMLAMVRVADFWMGIQVVDS